MSVYVDPLFKYGGSKTFRWTTSCHMYADTEAELHAMAKKIGLKREWFQDTGRLPHYDLNVRRHAKAISTGVIQHTREEAVSFWRAKRWIGQRAEAAPKAVRQLSLFKREPNATEDARSTPVN